MLIRLLIALSLVCISSSAQKNLDVYWIDVEGGAATLLVAPSGESMLIDTGWAVGDRDPKRIYAAAQQAGLKKIDYVFISHFHADHVGGLATWPLARRSFRTDRTDRAGTPASALPAD